ncbi:hypothetical protein [Nocardioides daeguensis]|uniref:Anti-sigma factor n=1 Tax=Nocardioides daeguensis TaxID=908359 RepID=A0ABP6VWG9_9ACTN|nr:hypothetical protein [Nocardioides daeguensis]MBV6726803.1 hypothetical protein [Nocardioides daeguensis]MCR1774445.1 hypothetical protein [Nocardioides daeguensis]
MTDLDHLAPLVGPALRERLRDERPDLEHLAATSLASGQQLRRRRRVMSGTVAGVAAVAAVSVAAGLVTGDGTAARDRSVATAQTSAPAAGLQVGQVLDLGDGLTGTVGKEEDALHVLGSSSEPGSGTGFAVLVSGPVDQIESWWSAGFDSLLEDWPGIVVEVSEADAAALGMFGKVDHAPASAPAGWTCEWFLVDDKATCTADDGGVASLVIRDASERDAWLSSPDKGAGPGGYTTEAHDGIFISVQGGRGTTDAEIAALGEGLAWVD